MGRNHRTIPIGIEHLSKAAVFVEVARAGSFSAAADALGLARSTVSDHVQRLEAALEVRLLERTTRRVRLTEEGTLMLEHMSVALGAWRDARALLGDRRSVPTGRLRVACPAGLASSLVAPALSELLGEHAGLTAELLVDDRIHDLVEEGIDVAVRTVAVGDPNLHVRRLGETPLRLLAAPALVDSMGDDLDALSAAPWVGHLEVERAQISLRSERYGAHQLRPRYRVLASSSEGELGFAIGGSGLVLLPELLAQNEMDQGLLVPVGDWVGSPKGIFAIFPARTLSPARTRALVDLLVRRFSA